MSALVKDMSEINQKYVTQIFVVRIKTDCSDNETFYIRIETIICSTKRCVNTTRALLPVPNYGLGFSAVILN